MQEEEKLEAKVEREAQKAASDAIAKKIKPSLENEAKPESSGKKTEAGKKPAAKKGEKDSKEISLKKEKKEIESREYMQFLEGYVKKLDYSSLFSYLGETKSAVYKYEAAEQETSKIAFRKEETISWDEIKQFTEEWKMDQIQNNNRSYESTEKRTAYKWWKLANPGVATVLYEISLT